MIEECSFCISGWTLPNKNYCKKCGDLYIEVILLSGKLFFIGPVSKQLKLNTQ